jgi:cyclase
MRRGIVLCVMLGAGAMSLAVAGYQDAGRGGRGGPPAEPGKLVEVTKVKDNLYMMSGGGGNVSVLVTDTGVVVVDSKLPGWGQPLLEKIRAVTDKPITTIINTHTHQDHVSGQVEFPGTIEVVAQENTKANMEKMDLFKQPANAKFLPKRTFKDKLSLLTGKDRIDLYYFGAGHTNGDAWVVFPSLRVMHAADMFPGKVPPFVDAANGGSGVAFPQTLSKAIATVKDVDTIISGHGWIMTVPELKEYAEYTRDFLTWAEAEMKAGKTADAAAAEYKIPEKYKGYTTNVRVKGDVEAIYAELKK